MVQHLAFASAALLTSVAANGGSKGTWKYEHIGPDNSGTQIVHTTKLTKNGQDYSVHLDTYRVAGTVYGNHTFGAVLNKDGQPVTRHGDRLVSNSPDFTSIMEHKPSGKLFTLTHFEDPNPAGAYLSEFRHNPDDCTIINDQDNFVEPVKHTDPEEDGGIWIPCSGTVTPWGTHLGSEEYEPDAQLFADFMNAQAATLEEEQQLVADYEANSYKVDQQLSYYGFPYPGEAGRSITRQNYRDHFNPYKFGHPWQLTITSESGDYTLRKEYALGRAAHEMCITMEDEITTYCTDDGTNVGFYKFISNAAGSYDAGSLYCADVQQVSGADGGKFDITWIKLGETSNAQAIKDWVHVDGVTFYDIFDESNVGIGKDDACPQGMFKYGPSWRVSCLKVKPGMDSHAAFLETRRACASLGGATEFSKWEGITYDRDANKLYTAMSKVYRGMLANSDPYDVATGDKVRVDEENQCGCIYEMDMDNFNVRTMNAILCGVPQIDGTCETDGISNPDNIVMLNGYNELLIAEDTSKHVHNFLWTLNLSTKELRRVASVEAGAEVTGPAAYHFPDVDTCDYTMFLSQHPGNNQRAGIYILGTKTAENGPSTLAPTSEDGTGSASVHTVSMGAYVVALVAAVEASRRN